jgi:serine protease Do
VKPAVVGVQVTTDAETVADRGGRGFPGMPGMPEGFQDLPEDHPFNEFFRRFGSPREFGGEGDNNARPTSLGAASARAPGSSSPKMATW